MLVIMTIWFGDMELCHFSKKICRKTIDHSLKRGAQLSLFRKEGVGGDSYLWNLIFDAKIFNQVWCHIMMVFHLSMMHC